MEHLGVSASRTEGSGMGGPIYTGGRNGGQIEGVSTLKCLSGKSLQHSDRCTVVGRGRRSWRTLIVGCAMLLAWMDLNSRSNALPYLTCFSSFMFVVAETTDGGAAMASIFKNAAALNTLQPSASSPLQSESIDEKEEKWLNSIDDNVSEEERASRVKACFKYVQNHLSQNAPILVAAAQEAANKHGMRRDEASRAIVHYSWVACYYNINTASGIRDELKLSSGSAQTIEKLLDRTASTPLRFSKRQSALVESLTPKSEKKVNRSYFTISGWMGVVYSMGVIGAVFSLLFFGYRVLTTSAATRVKRRSRDDKKLKTSGKKVKS